MSDLISRQAAIDAFKPYADYESNRTNADWVQRIELVLHDMPSAQPDIIRCRDCRWRKDQSDSTAWLPCRAIATPSEFYCAGAERRTDGAEQP